MIDRAAHKLELLNKAWNSNENFLLMSRGLSSSEYGHFAHSLFREGLDVFLPSSFYPQFFEFAPRGLNKKPIITSTQELNSLIVIPYQVFDMGLYGSFTVHIQDCPVVLYVKGEMHVYTNLDSIDLVEEIQRSEILIKEPLR